MINQFIKRTIKNGRIKFNNQTWITKGDVSHLEGMRLVFGTYPPDYTILSLWGGKVWLCIIMKRIRGKNGVS